MSDLGSSENVGSPAEEEVYDGGMALFGSEMKRRQTILPVKTRQQINVNSLELAIPQEMQKYTAMQMQTNSATNRHVRSRNAGRVACCPLVSHIEYAPCALLRLAKRRNRQTDRRTEGLKTVTLRLPLYAASVKITNSQALCKW